MRSIFFAIMIFLLVPTHAYSWVVKSDFEGGVLGQVADGKKSDPNSSGAYFAHKYTVYSNTNAHTGKQSAEAVLQKGSNGGDWGLVWKFPKCTEGKEFWYRAWINFPSNFKYATEHGAKGLRLKSVKSGNSDQRFINIYPKNNHILTENWAAEVKTFYQNNTKDEVRSYPNLSGWEALETYVKCSATPGKAVYRIWRNGKLWFEDKQTPTLMDAGGYIEQANLLTLYSSAQVSPVKQSVWIDDVIITNERPNNYDSKGNPFIGVGNVKYVAPPRPPSIN